MSVVVAVGCFWRTMHESGQKFNVRKCKTMRLDESYRLVKTVLVLNSHSGKIPAVSHIPQSGDATTFPAGDATSPTGDVDASAGDAHL
jgi:hypothetical protein